MMPPNQSSVALFSSCLQSFPASESPQTKKREVISMTACWLIPPFLVMGSLPHFCTKSLKGFFAEPFKVTLELVFYVQTQFSLRSLKKLAQLRSCICTWQTWSLQLGLLIKWLWKTSQYHGVHACSVTSVTSNSLKHYGPYPTRLLCPRDSPGKSTGVGCHAFRQRTPWPRDWTYI